MGADRAGTLSQQLVAFASQLRYEDLPDDVVDKAKACLFHNSAAAIVGMTTDMGTHVRRVVAGDIALSGASVFGSANQHSIEAAAFANATLMATTNQTDSYSVLTHPGPCILPAALAVAEVTGVTGQELITAVVAGYEVQSRLARQTLGSVHSRGYRAAPVFGTLGAAIAAGKLYGLDAENLHNALALAASVAGGGLETALQGTSELRFHEPTAARNGVMSARYAPVMRSSASGCLDGTFGFFNAFLGSSSAALTHRFDGEGGIADVDDMLDGLGFRFAMLDVAFKVHPTQGYNNPVVDLIARMRKEHQVRAGDIESVDIEMNWLETSYPTPSHPRQSLRERRPGTTYAVAAQMLVDGTGPQYVPSGAQPRSIGESVETMMDKIFVTGSQNRPYFAPRIRLQLRGGAEIADEFAGDELKVGLSEVVDRFSGWLAENHLLTTISTNLADAVVALDSADSLQEYFAAVSS